MGEPAKPLALESLVAQLVGQVAQVAAAEASAAARTAVLYYDQDTAPVARSCYLRAARRNAFPNSRVGNRILATRADVDAWIEGLRRTKRAPPPPTADSPEAILAAAGFRPTR